VPSQVVFGPPTASCEVGSLDAHDCLTSESALDHFGMFVNDTWAVGRLTMSAGLRYDRYNGWLPEQEQLASVVGPVVLQAKTFAEQQLFTWNQVAPRVGVVFDLAGDGRTVIKGNYGLYWHNPGAALGNTANPNTATKSETWSWNDANGDRRFQAGENTTLVTRSLEGSIGIDPDISAPYTHEASFWLERQLSNTMGVRTGFVYKTEDNLTQTYQPGRDSAAFTVPYSFTDIGIDGRSGTADDRTITLYGMPTSAQAQFPNNQVVMNTDRYGRYKTFEVSMNRRYSDKWSASVGGSHTWMTNFPTDLFPNNPNLPGVQDRTTWQFKATASYDAPWGIRLSPVLRHQSGLNFARTVTITAPAGLIGTSGTGDRAIHYLEPMNANREDNIWVFDVRAEKQVDLIGRLRTRLFLDVFNITNSHASETISRATGLSYLKPSAILAPRVARLGFRLLW
jgi:hypothetical protein